MRKISRALAAAVALAVSSAAFADTPGETLMRVDAEFNALAQKEGYQKAFLAYIADDAAMFNGSKILAAADMKKRFADAVAQQAKNPKAPRASLVWTPVRGEMSADGTMGFTYGTSIFTAPPDASGKVEKTTGSYLTVWRKQADGSWKFVADMGTEDPPAK